MTPRTYCKQCGEDARLCDCGAPTVQPAQPQLDEINRLRAQLAAIKAKKEGRRP